METTKKGLQVVTRCFWSIVLVIAIVNLSRYYDEKGLRKAIMEGIDTLYAEREELV